MGSGESQDQPVPAGIGSRTATGGPLRRTAHAFSAGGLVLRGQGDARQILLVGRDQQHRAARLWSLPKGTPLPGESPPQTALREVREETGIEVAITGYAGVITYSFIEQTVRFRKRVAYYTMIAIGGDIAQHDHEYDFVSWFDLTAALQVMRYPNEIELVRQAGSQRSRG
jgi:8-oxo-dGTP pyrophosphatase MutT (NUDIX family)